MNLRVATYNIRNGDADDGPNSWDHRQETLIEVIRSLHADVIGLQEVLDYQLNAILSALPEYRSIGVGRIDGERTGEYAPILYLPDKLALNDSGWFWHSETPDMPGSKSWQTACERICTWASFGSLTVFNTHLDHVSAIARRESTRGMLERTPDGPCVIIGDLNALPNDEPLEMLRQAGFIDAGAQTNLPTFHDWRREQGSRIDYILGRNIEFFDSKTRLDPWNGRDGSDHFPLIATCSIKQQQLNLIQ